MGVTPSVEVSSGWLAWLSALGPIGIIVIVAVVLVLGGAPAWKLVGAVWSALKSLLGWLFTRSSAALSDVVTAVEKAKAKLPPEAAKTLHDELLQTTTPTTRATIGKVQIKAKEVIRQEEVPK